MHRHILFRLLFCAFAAFAIAVSASAQTQAGAIKAMRVQGDVVAISSAGKTAVVKNGQALTETDTVITRAGGSVVLVFANGSSIRLAENSRLAIEEFKMDPTGANIVVKDLQAEPSVSRTRLNLAYGEMVGNVKKLNKAAGSSFDVTTPVGAAGVRGTTFRIVMRFDAQGVANFSLATSEGVVDFAANGSVQLSGPAQSEVPAGTEITAVVTVDPATGTITGITVDVPSSISTNAQTTITSAVTEQIEATAQVTITPTEQTPTSRRPDSPTQTGRDNASDQGLPNIPENPGQQRSPN